MNVSTDQLAQIRELIMSLHRRPFDRELVLSVTQSLSRLVDSQYGSFYLLAPSGRSRPFTISTNPPEYLPVYFSVAHEDYLLASIVSTHREYVARRWPHHEDSANRNFMGAVQSARPISDVVYSPLIVGGALIGFMTLSRAGLASPVYSDADLEVIRFIMGFVNDAFERSLTPPAPGEHVAYLDYQGRVVNAGARIREVLRAILASGPLSRSFHSHYRLFVHGPFRPRVDHLRLCAENRAHSFLFKMVRPQGMPLRHAGVPFVSVELVDEPVDTSPVHLLGLPALSRHYGFTPREREVIEGIYKGLSNKAIAHALCVDESTVKRHTHNIYEKSGFRSRVELVLGLSRARQNQLKL